MAYCTAAIKAGVATTVAAWPRAALDVAGVVVLSTSGGKFARLGTQYCFAVGAARPEQRTAVREGSVERRMGAARG